MIICLTCDLQISLFDASAMGQLVLTLENGGTRSQHLHLMSD